MATPETLKNIFEKPVQDSLSSWTHLLPKAETEASFDMFGEICHRVKLEPGPANRPPPVPRLEKACSWNGHMSDADDNAFEIFGELCYKARPEEEIDVGSPENYEDADDGRGERKSKKVVFRRSCSVGESKGSGGSSFPPPITSIGRCGKPRVYFKSFRQDGRFVLREIRIPTQRLLQSTREDGRLRMQVLGPVEDVRGRGEGKGEVENDEGGGEGGE